MSSLAAAPPTPSSSSRVMAWVLRVLAAGLVVALVAVLVQTYQVVGDNSPVVTVTGSDPVSVAVETAKFSGPPTRTAVVRVVNGTREPMDVTAVATLEPGPAVVLSGSITAALTVEGTQSRSGALDGLASPVLHLEPGSTVPVTVEVVLPGPGDEAAWSDVDAVVLSVSRTS